MNKAKRKAIIAGNWKMNKTATEAAALIGELVPAGERRRLRAWLSARRSPDLCKAVELSPRHQHPGRRARTCHFEKSGAYHRRNLCRYAGRPWAWNMSSSATPSAASISPRQTRR